MMKLLTVPGGEIIEVEDSIGVRLYEQGKAKLIPEEKKPEAKPPKAEAPEADREPEAAADPEAPEAKPARKSRKK